MKIFFSISIVILLLSSCNENAPNAEFKNIDSTNLESIGITPKKEFEFNSILKVQGDTLELVTCAEYVIRPFGNMNSEEDLLKSTLSNYKITEKRKDDSIYFYYTIEKGNNKFDLFFENDEYDSDHSYILSGEIYDSTLETINKIRIGMTLKEFLCKHFKSYPEEIGKAYEVYIFDYCVEDIKHAYTFKNERLISIKYYQ